MKRYINLLCLAIFAQAVYGQLSGIRTIPGDYATIKTAVEALNSSGVGPGGVTFNVAAGHTESMVDSILLTATGTVSSPIIFQKSGEGANPLVTRTGDGSLFPYLLGAQGDAIIILQGSDFMTFDGIDISTANSNVEYGYYLRKASDADGCKNVTIKNSTIIMTGGYFGTTAGICSSNNDEASSPESPDGINVTSIGGRHENITLVGNTIMNVNTGIILYGYKDLTEPFGFYDQNFIIGMEGQGNTIQNFYNIGIYLIHHNNANVSYNTINNSVSEEFPVPFSANGIFHDTSFNASATFNHNIITLAAEFGNLHAISFGTEGEGIGVFNCNDNIIHISEDPVYETECIYAIGTAGSITINGNTFSCGNLDSWNNLSFIYINSSTNDITISGNHTSGTIIKAGGIFSGYTHMGNPTGGIETITNNNFSNITINGGVGTVFGINSTSSSFQERVCTGNTVTSISSAGGATLYAISVTGGASNQISGNVINAISSGNGYLIGILASGNSAIHANNLSNMTANGSSASLYGIQFTGGDAEIYDNNIYNLTHNSTAGYEIYGIINAGSGTLNCYRNRISDIISNGYPGYLSGIAVSSGSATYIFNNFISEIKSPVSGSINALSGMRITSDDANTIVGVYNNTIYLNATSNGINFGTAGIFFRYLYSNIPSATLDLRNNIIVNNSTAKGTGYTVAFRIGIGNQDYYALTSNNNNFYAGTPGPKNLIYYDGTNTDQTLSSYQARVAPRESNSVSENPPFVNVTIQPYDLHLLENVTTQCESGGSLYGLPVSIFSDFDEDIRNATTPDIGADEFSGILSDMCPPNVYLTPLPNTAGTGDRNLGAIIFDASGLPENGIGLPMLYWKIDNGAYSGVQATFNGGNQYGFTFGNGAALGNTISYYIVARDNVTPAPNIIAKPNGGAAGYTSDPPSCSTPPSAPYTYTIVGSLNGNYTVGSGGNYPSLTGAGGLFADINGKVVTGNLIVTIISDLSETGANALNQWLEEGAGNYTLTIQPDAGTLKTISANYSGSLIRLNGADRVTFDGRYNEEGNYLAFNNNSTSGTVFELISLGDNAGACYNTIRNCKMKMNYSYYGTSGIKISGADNDHNTLQNNEIRKVNEGILAEGTSVSNPGAMDDLNIIENTIGSDNPEELIGETGIRIGNAIGALITGNDIYNIFRFGIQIGFNSKSTRVSMNKIHHIGRNTTGGNGIRIYTCINDADLLIDNNLIYAMEGQGIQDPGGSMHGILINGATGNVKIVYNSIVLFGGYINYNQVTSTACIVLENYQMNNIIISDNILQNTMNNTVNQSDKAYAVYSGTNASAFSGIDYNDYYISEENGLVGYLGGDRATLADWQAATGQDAGSISEDPVFNDINDFRPLPSSPVIGAGAPITGIDHDFLNSNRDDNTPTMGAYEIGGDYAGPVIQYVCLGNSSITTGRDFSNIQITDYSGVNVSPGTRPRVYFKRLTDANVLIENTSSTGGWKWAEANGNSSPFDFSIDYSLLNGGVGEQTTIQYFVVAQDLQVPPLIRINSGIFAAPPSSVALTADAFPIGGTINSYMIVPALSGVINVGEGQTYTSLTADAATGLFKAINSSALTGDVIVNIVSDLSETGTIGLNQWYEDGPGNYTLTIQPASESVKTISGSYEGGLIRLNGADRVIIDGRYNGSGNYLAFVNTATSSVAAIRLISLGIDAGACDNIIRNCNLRTGSNYMQSYCIIIGGPEYLAYIGADNDNNIIRSNNISNAGCGIWAHGSAVTNPGLMDQLNILDNYIGADVLTNSIVYNGISVGNATGCEISGNAVYNISSYSSVGIQIGEGFVSSKLSRNMVGKIYCQTDYYARGISINTGNPASDLTIDNNVIYGINGNGGGGPQGELGMAGLMIGGNTGGLKIYYNSVYMSGQYYNITLTAAFALNSTSITNIDLRNNIFQNSMYKEGDFEGRCYAIYSLSPTTAFTNIDNNDYYTSGRYGALGYLGWNLLTLADWQANTGQDVHSLSSDPRYTSTSDLKLYLSSPALQAGTPITGIDYDFLDTDRDEATPAMGAYETGVDLWGPFINYTPLMNTSSLSNRILDNVVMSDTVGINIDPGTRPRIYYKRLTDGNVWNDNTSSSDGWKWVEATGSTSPFDFIIDYAKLNGGEVTVGTKIQYFIIAQDLRSTPNVSINSGSFAAVPASVALTSAAFPIGGTIREYNISIAFAGTVTVGSGGDFPNLSGPDGLFVALNENVLSGDLTALITSDITEVGWFELNQWDEEGTGDYYLTIKPAGGLTPTISGYAYDTPSVITFTGARRVIIDGSNNNSSSRDLTISNEFFSEPSCVSFKSDLTNMNNDITIRNCIFLNSITYGESACITMRGIYYNDPCLFDQITIENNSFMRSVLGINVIGKPGQATNLAIKNNVLDNQDQYAISSNGIVLKGVSSGEISGNKIGNLYVGVNIKESCSNLDIYNNEIYNLGGHGIDVGTYAQNANINIYNNLIRDISGEGYDHTYPWYIIYNPIGIFLDYGQSGINIYNNSIKLSGNTLNQYNALSMGICVMGASQADIRNNIISNNLGLLDEIGYGSCAIYAESGSEQFSIIDHNDYYVNPSGPGIKAIGKIGTTTTALTLPDWQTASGQDMNSISADPLYTTNSDLHLQEDSPAIGGGTPVSIVTDDYDGNSRHLFKPTIGAYEYPPLNFFFWTGLIDGDWNKPGNWVPSGIPGENDDVGIPLDPLSDPDVFPGVPSGVTVSCDELFVAPDAVLNIESGGTVIVGSEGP